MAELADAHDSGSCGATHAGSSPVIRTKMQTNRIAMRFVFIYQCFFLVAKGHVHVGYVFARTFVTPLVYC